MFKLNLFSLLGIFIFIIVGVDSEVTEFIRVLIIGDNTDPITQAVLLQVFLGQVFQISLGEVDIGVDIQLHLDTFKGDIVTQVVNFVVNLHAALNVLFLKEI